MLDLVTNYGNEARGLIAHEMAVIALTALCKAQKNPIEELNRIIGAMRNVDISRHARKPIYAEVLKAAELEYTSLEQDTLIALQKKSKAPEQPIGAESNEPGNNVIQLKFD